MLDRVAIFIDGSNLYHALETNFRRHDLNYTEFISKLCGSRHLFRAYYYNVLQDPPKRTLDMRQSWYRGRLLSS